MENDNIRLNHQIPASIIEIIRNTEYYCFIVSPYFQPWKQLTKALEYAATENKKIIFLFRDDQYQNSDIHFLNEEYNFDVIFISNLHAKIYVNEKEALIASMNLYDHSKENNFEIAYSITNNIEVKQIVSNIILGEMITTWKTQSLEGRCYESIIDRSILQNSNSRNKIVSNYQKLDSYCIRCGKSIAYNFNRPFCTDCYKQWELYQNYEYNEKYCLKCGKEYETTILKPLCIDCFKSCENVFRR